MNHIPFSDFSPPIISSYTGNEPAFTLVYRALQDLFKCCTQYASKFGKLSSGQRAGKGYFSSQSQGRAMPKNIQTTTQLLISHTGKVMLKILQARLQQYVNCELPDVQAEFRKRQRNQRFQHLLDHRKSKRSILKTIKKTICFIDYAKAFDCV